MVDNDDEEYFQRPNNARELLYAKHLTPFLMKYIKEMKNESIEIMIHPIVVQFLTDRHCSLEDLSLLSKEDLFKFKELFLAHRVSESHRGLSNQMNELYDILLDIMAKSVPVEDTSIKIEQVMTKIKLMPMPEGVYHEDF